MPERISEKTWWWLEGHVGSWKKWKKLQQFLLLTGLMKEQTREGWRGSLWTCRKAFSPSDGAGRDVGTCAVGGQDGGGSVYMSVTYFYFLSETGRPPMESEDWGGRVGSLRQKNGMKQKGVECLCRGVIIILDLGSMLVKEETEHMRQEQSKGGEIVACRIKWS